METRGWKWWNVHTVFVSSTWSTYLLLPQAYCLRGWQNIPAINFLNLRPNKTKGLWPLWPSRRVAVDISLTRRRPSCPAWNCKILRMFLRILRTRCRRVPRWRQWIEGHEFQTCEKWENMFCFWNFGAFFWPTHIVVKFHPWLIRMKADLRGEKKVGVFFVLQKR